MALLAVQDVGDGLGSVTFVAPDTDGDEVPAGAEVANHHVDGVFLLVDNASAASVNVVVENRAVVAVPAGAIGVVPCNRGSAGVPLAVDYSAVASVTVAAIHV